MAGQMTIRFTKDIDQPLVLDTLSTLFQQGDSNANVLRIEIKESGKAMNLNGVAVTGQVEREDGYRLPLTGKAENGAVEVTLPEEAYNVAGNLVGFVRLASGNVKRTILRFAAEVVQTSDGPLLDSSNVIPSVDDLIAKIEEMEAGTANANAAANEARQQAIEAEIAAVAANGWARASVYGTSIPAGSPPSLKVETLEDGSKRILFGIPAGATPNITFEVATGEPGSGVQMEQTGTPDAPHIKLTIPSGEPGAVEGVDYYEGAPAALGTASPGTSNGVARGNHVHPMPGAADIKGFLESCSSVATYAIGAAVVFQKDPTKYTYLVPRLNYVTGMPLTTSGSAGNRTIVASAVNAGSSTITITVLTLKETGIITEWDITDIQRAIISASGVAYSKPETLSVAFNGMTLK